MIRVRDAWGRADGGKNHSVCIMACEKAEGPHQLLAELLKLGLPENASFSSSIASLLRCGVGAGAAAVERCHHQDLAQGEGQKKRGVITKKSIALVAYAGKVLL